ncbi:hypothetical protein CCACVL1_03057, partial [Corchorus capsularis]
MFEKSMLYDTEEFFEPRAIECYVFAALVSLNLIDLRNTSIRLISLIRTSYVLSLSSKYVCKRMIMVV